MCPVKLAKNINHYHQHTNLLYYYKALFGNVLYIYNLQSIIAKRVQDINYITF